MAEALERLEIGHLERRKFQELSGGERQMVLVARALAQQSDLLVMDEPTANLDYSNQVKILKTVRSLAGQGYGILMTSHYPDHAFLAWERRTTKTGVPTREVSTPRGRAPAPMPRMMLSMRSRNSPPTRKEAADSLA